MPRKTRKAPRTARKERRIICCLAGFFFQDVLELLALLVVHLVHGTSLFRTRGRDVLLEIAQDGVLALHPRVLEEAGMVEVRHVVLHLAPADLEMEGEEDHRDGDPKTEDLL